MTQWYSKILGGGVEALPKTHELQATFLPLFVASGQPVNMAVFGRYDPIRNIETVYFSPGAAALAEKYGAEPCEKPEREGRLSLIVGDARCWELFYPGTK